MKMVPEKYRSNRTFIKRSQTLVKNCMKLKSEVSEDDIDPDNIFKLNIKLKNVSDRPNLDKLLTNVDFEGSYILPIVDDKKELYDILDKEYIELLNGTLDEMENGTFMKVDNVTKSMPLLNYENIIDKVKVDIIIHYEETSRLHALTVPYAWVIKSIVFKQD